MSPQRLVGIALVAAAGVLLGLELSVAGVPAGGLPEALNGSYPDRTINQLAGGTAALCVDVVLSVRGSAS